MSLVTRYFSTSAAGTGDGTTWDNRAALFSGGAYSSVITGFNFGGTDGMEARIGPGTYTVTATLQASSFSVAAPTALNPLILHGCDGSGTLLAPPQPNWIACMAAWNDSALPVIATTTNIVTINQSYILCRLLKFTASGQAGALGIIDQCGLLEWCSIANSSSNANAMCARHNCNAIVNCLIAMTGSTFDCGIRVGNNLVDNCRITGVTGSSGNRAGIIFAGTSGLPPTIAGSLIKGYGGPGILSGDYAADRAFFVAHCVIVGNGGDGIRFSATASQTRIHAVHGCAITGNGGYGVNDQGAANVIVSQSRLRNNTSGNFNVKVNYPVNYLNDVSAGSDAAEYVDAANGDYRIKAGSAIWGNRYGIADQAAGGLMISPRMSAGFHRSSAL